MRKPIKVDVEGLPPRLFLTRALGIGTGAVGWARWP